MTAPGSSAKPAKLLVITELFLPTKGGTAVWFAEVYRRIGGKEIHVVTADVPRADEYDRSATNTIHRLSLRRHRWLKPESLLMYLKLLLASLALAARHRFSAVHAGRALPEGLVGWLVARLFGLPLVIYAHGEELTGWRMPNKYRAMCFALRHADRVIANSRFTAATLAGMGVCDANIVLIFPGVDTGVFRPNLATAGLREAAGIPPACSLLLSVGRLQARKGFDMVIRSVAALRRANNDVAYAIIGIGEDRARLEQIAADGGVSERVFFLGEVSREDLPRWYNAADLFLMPNRDIDGDTEGFGIVFLEAAACGVPVIAGTAGGTGDAVEHGASGLRIDGTDQAALTEAIRDLLSDGARRRRMGKLGCERVHRAFSWDRVAERTLSLQTSIST